MSKRSISKLKDNIQCPVKVKQLLYGKHVLISTFLLYPVSIALSVFYIIFGFTEVNTLLGLRIVSVLFGLFMLGLSIWVICGLIKHRAITANLTVDKKGIYYNAKGKFFLSWEQIHRIEIKSFSFNSRQVAKPYIVFYTNYANQKKIPLTADQISDEFIFTYYTWKLHSFIENQVKRTVIENCKSPKRFRNREYRKRHRELNKLWRKTQ